MLVFGLFLKDAIFFDTKEEFVDWYRSQGNSFEGSILCRIENKKMHSVYEAMNHKGAKYLVDLETKEKIFQTEEYADYYYQITKSKSSN